MEQNNRYENHGLRQDMNNIKEKLQDAYNFYIHLGRVVAPIMITELIIYISNYKRAEHYNKQFG